MLYGWIIAAIAIFALLTELIRRAHFIVSLVAFLVIPAGLTFFWVATNAEAPLFSFVKVYSVGFAALFIAMLRITNWIQYRWAQVTGYLILFINILEAIVTDMLAGGMLNAIAGVLLLLSQSYPRFIYINESDPQRNLQYDLGIGWVLAYTLWNFTFVYGSASASAAFALCHLAVPLLLMRGQARYYMQVRVFSLAIFMLVRISLPYEPFIFFVPEWFDSHVADGLRLVSLAVAIYIAARSFLHYFRGERPRNLVQALARMWRGRRTQGL